MIACTEERQEYQEMKGVGGVLSVEDSDIPRINIFDESETRDFIDRTNNQSIIPKTVTNVTGYSRRIVRKSYPKMKFYKADADKIGVDPDRIYSVEFLTIEKDINTNGKDFYTYESPLCGGTPYTNGQGEEISNFDRMGYKVVSNSPAIFSTHLIYVDCIYPQGTPIKRYYPRDPAVLQWNYIVNHIKIINNYGNKELQVLHGL